MRKYFEDKQRKYIFEAFLKNNFIKTIFILQGGTIFAHFD